jgi:RNA polymerase sigma factor (TIGR02999 family)
MAREVSGAMPDSHDQQSNDGPVTRLLRELGGGRREAFDELLPYIYDELRRIAHRHRRGERADHTLTTTALVHEAYLKLADQRVMDFQNRAHFLAIAAQAMRRILVSHARARHAAKRGEGHAPVALDEAFQLFDDKRVKDVLDLDEALQRLHEINPRHAEIVQCRFFGGLTIEETAQTLDIAPITVTRDWRMARAWLKHELDPAV